MINDQYYHFNQKNITVIENSKVQTNIAPSTLQKTRTFVLITSILLLIVPFFKLYGEEKTQPKYDTLAGPLPAIISRQDFPYLVITDIEVPPNKIVTIEPGVVILFKNFTGLHVRGKLIVRGTVTDPVIFTSEFDKNHNKETDFMANPFDWNGIYIHSDGFGSYLEHCSISFTVYGLVSETKFIRLDPVVFNENGKSNFVMENQEKKDVIKNSPYHYVLSKNEATVNGVQIKILKDPAAPRRNIVRYSGIAAGILGLAAGIYFNTEFSDAKSLYEEYNSVNPNDDITFNKRESDRDLARENFKEKRSFTLISYGIGAIGLTAFTWSFTF